VRLATTIASTPGQQRHQRGSQIGERGAGGDLVVDQHEAAGRLKSGEGRLVDEVRGGVAVRLLEPAEQRRVQLLARGMEKEDVLAAGARAQLGMDGLTKADRGLGQPEHEHRAGQGGGDQRGKVARAAPHQAG
jgi:hypothetical protein